MRAVHPGLPSTLIRIGLLLLATMLLLPGAASAALFDPHFVQSEVLENGLRVIVEQDDAAPTVAVQIAVRVGSADETKAQSGIAHLLEHALWAGRVGEDPRAAIEDAGGSTNAGTLRDFTRYYAVVPADDWQLALQAVSRIVLQPSYSDASIQREKEVIEEEASARADERRAMLVDLAFATVYGSHPYARPVEGSGESRAEIRKADLDRFYQIWYVPNNLTVILTGHVDAEAAIAEVKHLFGALAPRPVPPREWPAVPRPVAGREVTIGTAGEDAYVMAAFTGPACSEPADVCASDVLTALLGNASFGRLKRSLQDRGVARAVGLEFLTQRDRALFGVWAVCKPKNVAEVKQTMREALAQVATQGVPAHELAIAKQLTAAGYVLANQTPADRATTLAFYDSLGDYREAERYLARVRAVTSEDMQRVARWYAGKPVWVVLGPKEEKP